MKKGDRLKVIANNGHGVKIGTIVHYESPFPNMPVCFKSIEYTGWIPIKDVALAPAVRKELEEEAKELEDKHNLVLSKIRYLDHNKVNVVNEDDFRLFVLLEIIENKCITSLDKASRITQMYKT